MYPVHIKYFGQPAPESGTCFIIAREGIMLRRETDWMNAVVPVKNIGVLDSEPARVTLTVPHIDAAVLFQAITFLRAVFERFHSEGIVLLYYSQENGWLIDVPQQTVSYTSIHKYDNSKELAGYKCLGTIHSHSDFAASHSSVDEEDEASFDGIHITFGHCHNVEGVSVSSVVSVNGSRFEYPLKDTNDLEVVDVLPGLFRSGRRWSQHQYIKYPMSSESLPSFPVEWMNRVEYHVPPLRKPMIIPTVPAVLAEGKASEPELVLTELQPELQLTILEVWLNRARVWLKRKTEEGKS